MNILDKIVLKKREEIKESRKEISIIELEESELFHRPCYSLRDFILDPSKTGIIAEFKRASPSKGIINDKVSVQEVTRGYAAAEASALSVLTDNSFFGGHKQDLTAARKANSIPVLRKDFMLDEYQVIEAKAWGADVILLIAAILEPKEILQLGRLAKSLGMSVLLEVHNKEELSRSICEYVDAVGVNNRNLTDFTVSVQHSYDLAPLIPDEFIKVSESGISDPQTIKELKTAGFQGFLIGENFMKEEDPGEAISAFVRKLKS
ncbi:indole-3-glycerol phosphate synthase TrpC [Rubrolithibacter danxiaensis]|uniref:indole-3-glycerol phosphate synthase TrpC n=1 Tax=Rubrolithibacter danxiaensis TaxID=3390805 RepID=UPI003BF79F28